MRKFSGIFYFTSERTLVTLENIDTHIQDNEERLNNKNKKMGF